MHFHTKHNVPAAICFIQYLPCCPTCCQKMDDKSIEMTSVEKWITMQYCLDRHPGYNTRYCGICVHGLYILMWKKTLKLQSLKTKQ